jgi:hypothetical protein
MRRNSLKISKFLKLCLIFAYGLYFLVNSAYCFSIYNQIRPTVLSGLVVRPTVPIKSSLDELSKEALNNFLQTLMGIFSNNNSNNVAIKDTFG